MNEEQRRREAIEILRAVRSFRRKQQVYFSKGYLNSDGKKALVAIIKRCVRLKPSTKKFLYDKFKEGSLDKVLVLLEYLEDVLEEEVKQSNFE